MISIIDYGTGNLKSVGNALKRTGIDFTVTADPSVILSSDRVLLPGVGEASSAMQKLRATGLDVLIPELKMPVLGICIGMQLMCRHSQEGDTPCLGIFRTDVCRLEASQKGLKVPHMGWNSITNLRTGLFEDIREGDYVYYVHSFAPLLCEDTVAVTDYGQPFSAALSRDNFYGTQFHPEKSGNVGERILRNFCLGTLK